MGQRESAARCGPETCAGACPQDTTESRRTGPPLQATPPPSDSFGRNGRAGLNRAAPRNGSKPNATRQTHHYLMAGLDGWIEVGRGEVSEKGVTATFDGIANPPRQADGFADGFATGS